MPYRKVDEQVSWAIIRARLDKLEQQIQVLRDDTQRLHQRVNDSLARLREQR